MGDHSPRYTKDIHSVGRRSGVSYASTKTETTEDYPDEDEP